MAWSSQVPACRHPRRIYHLGCLPTDPADLSDIQRTGGGAARALLRRPIYEQRWPDSRRPGLSWLSPRCWLAAKSGCLHLLAPGQRQFRDHRHRRCSRTASARPHQPGARGKAGGGGKAEEDSPPSRVALHRGCWIDGVVQPPDIGRCQLARSWCGIFDPLPLAVPGFRRAVPGICANDRRWAMADTEPAQLQEVPFARGHYRAGGYWCP